MLPESLVDVAVLERMTDVELYAAAHGRLAICLSSLDPRDQARDWDYVLRVWQELKARKREDLYVLALVNIQAERRNASRGG